MKVKVKVPAIKLPAVLVDRVITHSGCRSLPGRGTSVMIDVEHAAMRVHTSLPT